MQGLNIIKDKLMGTTTEVEPKDQFEEDKSPIIVEEDVF